MTFDITQTIDHSIVTAYASGVASGVCIVAATLWLSSAFTFVTVDIPAALPTEIVVGLTAGAAVVVFLCGHLLFTHHREESEHTGDGGSTVANDDGTVAPSSRPKPPIDNETSSGGGDPLAQRLERRSDLNNDGDVSESQTTESSSLMTDETPRRPSRDREDDCRFSDASSASGSHSADSERDSRGGVGVTAREQQLTDDEDEHGMAEGSELPEAYRHELPNLRD